jgi:hypothetical protein
MASESLEARLVALEARTAAARVEAAVRRLCGCTVREAECLPGDWEVLVALALAPIDWTAPARSDAEAARTLARVSQETGVEEAAILAEATALLAVLDRYRAPEGR